MDKKYDVIVIGGGPAGLLAAGFAAKRGARVLLLEKNRRCGEKLLLTGKGRCNVTNSEADPRRFAEHFGVGGRALLTALYAFGSDDVIEFFEGHGVPLRRERGGRIFPAQGGADAVCRALLAFARESGVEIRCDAPVDELILQGGRVVAVRSGMRVYTADNYIVATGGLSYPSTGCTGDGYRWARDLGHRLVDPQPALVPVLLQESWTGDVSRFNLKNIRIGVRQDGKVLAERFGEAFFTRSGIGGPIVLDLSSTVRDALQRGQVELVIDLKPAVEEALFDKRVQREFAEQNNKDFRNALGNLLPRDMIPLFVRLSQIDPGKKCHSITRQERESLVRLFKELTLHVKGYAGFEKAIVTAGGIDVKDIDMRTMRSRKTINLFFAGEIIDLDGPTGGFNLQLCWSTGYLAAQHAAKGEMPQ